MSTRDQERKMRSLKCTRPHLSEVRSSLVDVVSSFVLLWQSEK